MAASVLLIDNDQSTIEEVRPVVAGEGCRVDHALPGVLAIRRILVEEPDLVILGINRPDEGWEFCRRLLTFLDKPLLLLISSRDSTGCVKGLDLGADDCMTKPVVMLEFVARVRALLRRDASDFRRRQRSFIVDDDLVVDLTRREVRLKDEPVLLTPLEFRLLSCLLRYEGEVIPQERLLSLVWGPECENPSGTVKQHIHHLRRKLETDPSQPRRIVTRRGEGYMLQRLAERAVPVGLLD